MHYTVIDGAPVRTEPGAGNKVATLLKYHRVHVLSSTVTKYNGVPTTFHEVELLTGVRGWVYAGYLDRLSETLASVKIQNQTENPYDAEQYTVWDGKVQYNLCGFFCLAYVLDIDIPIEWMLDTLKEKKSTLMQRVFRNRGLTGWQDLAEFLDAYEVPSISLFDVFRDKISKTIIFTAARLENILATHQVIIAVSINKRTGRLARSGIRHWVVVDSVTPIDYGGIVEIYNPFGNKYEAYGWDEFAESVGIPSGVMIHG